MAGITSTQAPSILPSTRQSPGSIKSNIAGAAATVGQIQDQTAGQAVNLISSALSSMQSQADQILQALRSPLPQPNEIYITDPTGKLIAWAGNFVENSISYSGLWASEAWFGGTGPANANIVINGSAVTVTNATITVTGSFGTLTISETATNPLTIVNGSSELIMSALFLNIGNTGTLENILISQTGVVMEAPGGASVVSISDTTGIQTTLAISGQTVNAVTGFLANGTPGVTGSTQGITGTPATGTIQYKDWSGTNQSATFVSGIALQNISASLGLITTI